MIRYVGPLLPPRIELTPPPWWERLDERPLVIVSQGTLANVDLGQLLIPAMQGLAGDELQLLLTTGGRDPARLGAAVPANAIVTEHVPFELALPRAAVLVTNGGYGSVQAALAHGVPLVVAGTGRTRRRWPPGWRGRRWHQSAQQRADGGRGGGGGAQAGARAALSGQGPAAGRRDGCARCSRRHRRDGDGPARRARVIP